MISLDVHRAALRESIDATLLLIDESHPGEDHAGPISRDARGLSIVLLFAAYENLLTALTRTLLEAAIALRVGNRRLQPGFRAFALEASAKSVRDRSIEKLYTHALPRLVQAADPGGRTCTIDPNAFPKDGSFMKRSQIELWCRLFGIPEPHLVLHRTWDTIDAVVAGRNAIAHGRLPPADVGRRYTYDEIRLLIDQWHNDWRDFLDVVETMGQSRVFYRKG